MPFFETLIERPNCLIGLRGALVVLHWTDVASLDSVEELRKVFNEATATGQRFLFVTYMEERTLSRHTPEDFRQGLADLLSEYGPKISAAVIVLEKPGFKGAMLRAIVSTITLLSGAKFPSSVHGKLDEAIAWSVERAEDPKPDADAVVDAINAQRARVAEQASVA